MRVSVGNGLFIYLGDSGKTDITDCVTKIQNTVNFYVAKRAHE